jgi:hypothetical protein
MSGPDITDLIVEDKYKSTRINDTPGDPGDSQ